MTAESLALIAGAVLSLAFSYIPGLNVRFAALASEYKRLIMAGLTFLVGAVVYGLSCLGWGEAWGIALVCDQAGLQALLQAWVLVVIANQGAYGVSPQLGAVREAKAAR